MLSEALQVCNPHAAGIDIGEAEHWVAVPPGCDPWGVATFASCRFCQGRFGRGHGWDGDYWPPQALPLLV